MSTTQKFHDSVLKHQTRHIIIDRIKDQFGFHTHLNAFTLPADVLEFEYELHRSHASGVTFTGVEKDRSTFERARQKMKLWGHGPDIDLRNLHDLDYWSEPAKKQFDFVWLDRCSPWCEDISDSLDQILENSHLSFKNGRPLIALTILAAREEVKNGDVLKELTAYDFSKLVGRDLALSDESDFARLFGIPRELNRVANTHGYTLVPQFKLHYRDMVRSTNTTPMIVFMFEVYKGKVKFNEFEAPIMESVAHTMKRRYLAH